MRINATVSFDSIVYNKIKNLSTNLSESVNKIVKEHLLKKEQEQFIEQCKMMNKKYSANSKYREIREITDGLQISAENVLLRKENISSGK